MVDGPTPRPEPRREQHRLVRRRGVPLKAMSDGYKEFVLDQLAGLEDLTCRAMFGGYGLALDGKFFGIIHKGRLYFRTDPATAPLYRAQHMTPFTPNATQTLKNYFEVPVDIVESAENLVEWARAAARR